MKLTALPSFILASSVAILTATAQSPAPSAPPAPLPPTAPVPLPPPGRSTTVTEQETTRTAAVADPALDRREGRIASWDSRDKKVFVRTKLAKEPIGFVFNSSTKYIDLDGKVVDPGLLKPETPVEVTFVEDGNTLVASTVLVQRVQAVLPGGGATLTMRETRKPGGVMVEEIQKTTSTTVNNGTLREFEPEFISLRQEGADAPVRYSYSKTTKWVNEAGDPVAADLIKSGLPVRVEYTKRGESLVADRVILVTPQAPAVRPGE